MSGGSCGRLEQGPVCWPAPSPLWQVQSGVCVNSLQIVFYLLRPTYKHHVVSEELHPSEPQINSHVPGWRDSEGWQCPKPLLLTGKSAGCELERLSNSSNAKIVIRENQERRAPTVLPSPRRPRHRARVGGRASHPQCACGER